MAGIQWKNKLYIVVDKLRGTTFDVSLINKQKAKLCKLDEY